MKGFLSCFTTAFVLAELLRVDLQLTFFAPLVAGALAVGPAVGTIRLSDLNAESKPSRQSGFFQSDDALPSRHLPRRPDRQFQHLAQYAQIRRPWPTVIRLPEVNAGLTDTDLISNFGNRQTTPDPSVAQVAAETWFARQ